jgi:GT2 family glycosyltransferase/glycosyltransferase involved in cell wall biosynthesis
METKRMDVDGSQAILVLGMHRAGTSALTRVLNLLGAALGSDLLPPAADNPKGFWEHRQVNRIQDRILDAIGREWFDASALPADWMQLDAIQRLLAELQQVLMQDFDSADLWAVKDPRSCLLLPAWEPILRNMNVRKSCLLVLRNPLEVVNSLEKRDRLSRPRIWMMWLRHLLDAELHSRSWLRAMVHYDRLLANWRAQMEAIAWQLELSWPVPLRRAMVEIEDFLDSSMRHHAFHGGEILEDEAIPEIVRQVYGIFLHCEDLGDPRVREQLDAIRKRIDEPSELLRNYLMTLEKDSRLVARRYSGLQHELDQTLESLAQQRLATRLADDALSEERQKTAEIIAVKEGAQHALRQQTIEREHVVRDWQQRFDGLQNCHTQLQEMTQRLEEQKQKLHDDGKRLIEEGRQFQDRNRQLQALVTDLERQKRRSDEGLAAADQAAASLADQLSEVERRLDQSAYALEEARRETSGHRDRAAALELVASRVQLSRSWKATQWLRSFHHHVSPLLVSKAHLIASEGMATGAKDEWTLSEPGSHFLVPCVPIASWVKITVKVRSSIRGRMEMYFDAGAGFQPAERLDLGEVAGTTTISLLHRVPSGTRLFKWLPMDRPGTVDVEQFDVAVQPKWSLYLRLLLRMTPRVKWSTFRRGAGMLARGRLREFLAKLRGALPRAQANVEGFAHLTADGPAPPTPQSRATDPSIILARRREIEVRPPGVMFYSLLSARSGLGAAGRGYERALRATGLPLEAHDVPSWTPQHPQDHRFFEGIGCAGGSQSGYRVNVIHQNPDMMPFFVGKYGPGLLKGKYNIGIWVWELPTLRPDWQPYFRALDEVWAPSEFVRQSIASISPVPVIRVPHVVDDLERFTVHDRRHFGIPDDVFVYLYSFDVSSYMVRKNPLMVIDAFRRIFGNRKDVMLLLKYHSMNHNPAAVTAMRKAAAAANIRLYPGVLTHEETISLHNVVDAFVSPHRAEGFGLNIAESLYFGKAVIATNYSGNADFMSPENSYPVDYDLVAIKESAGPYLAGYLWANPRFDDLCGQMKLAFEDETGRKARGRRAQQTIRETLSVEAVADTIRGRLGDLGLLSSPMTKSLLTPRFRAPISLPAARRGVETEPLEQQPVISMITPVYNVPAEYLERCIESVISQSYPNWELCLCDDCSTDAGTLAVLDRYQGTDPRIKIVHLPVNRGIAGASNQAVELSTGDFLAMLDNDDELHPDALYWIARSINEQPDADLLYTDEDKIEPDGRHTEQYYKPDWSPEHLRSVMYLLHLLVVRRQRFLEVGMFRDQFTGAQDYDLALRISEVSESIVHVPKVLYHWRKIPGSAAAIVDAKPQALEAAKRALEEHVGRIGLDGNVVPGKLAGMFRVRPTIRGNPRVTLVITTDARVSRVEGRGKIDLVRNFVDSICRHTSYSNFEILVVDNANLSPGQRDALVAQQCRIASYDGPQSPFNFARKANFAFAQVETEHLVLLNDDMEISNGDWLTALLELSQLADVGAVGAKLLTPDHRIQHAGVVLGVNNGAAHVYHGYPADTVGYGGFPNLIRNFSAVTGACLATRKSVIAKAGGFDERFAIDYNDTSFCLAVRSAGYRVVYTPYSELYHFESVTAQRTAQNPAEVELFNRLWGNALANDPYYNPNLPRGRHDYVLES